MTNFVSIFELILIGTALVLGMYNWFYYVQAHRAKSKLGIGFPGIVNRMLVINLFFPIITVCFLLISFVIF